MYGKANIMKNEIHKSEYAVLPGPDEKHLPLPDKEWLTVEDIHDYFAGTIPLDTIRSWIRNGRLPGYQPGKVYIIWRDDFMRFVKNSRIKPDGTMKDSEE